MPEVLLRTVTGPVRVAAIDGTVLPHEHLRTDMRWAVGIDSDPHRWLDEEMTVSAELRELRQSEQLGLVVELTCMGMGRDAAALARIAAGSRVPVIASTGLFAEPFTNVGDEDVDSLTARLMEEIVSGVDGTGVFPGVIGEVGSWGPEPTAREERCLVAAARASLRSRLPVATHGRNGLALLEILLGQNLPGSRIAVGYAGTDLGAARKIAESGAYVSLGALGLGADQAARLALGLIEDGHAGRLLLSTGLSRVAQVRRYDGPGYAHLFHALLPRLREAGTGEDVIRLITHDNPLRWLTDGFTA
ncbi:parathion hydrolase [[Actinomadura] parvosata subsp. kistnae]|uniref:Aryldialkylphosphatase n=1 Tax=[Actinomadura] parvosata subsp. kistnae TaxID=1909395 RepID=A0A1V0A4E4_9ACTN|nr:aryldialkylphosphatase [Nonomuraea sp. ATCC 55076]AQZ65077.1 aryldialkylphosphatase [Nonomuraea sp. ATCC 55076]SPL96344.1 parathion hydrolase [Actinomadura parvosata subsp. kistnae]